MEKINGIPTSAKVAIGTVGAVAGLAFGLPLSTVAGAVAGGALVGGAVSTAAYAVFNHDNLSWEGAGSAFISGFSDGYMWGGLGSAVAGVKSYASTVKVSGNVYSESVGYSSGNGLSKPNQVHHYATDKSKTYTQAFKDITDKYGLDLDADWNKDLLPHQGRHPNAYHDFVLDEMRNIDNIANGNTDIFLDLYESEIKSIIRDNPNMLYSNYWKGLKE